MWQARCCLVPFDKVAGACMQKAEALLCTAAFIRMWEPSYHKGLFLSFLIRFFQLLWPVHCHRRGTTGHLPFQDNSRCGSPTLRLPPALLAFQLFFLQALTNLALPLLCLSKSLLHSRLGSSGAQSVWDFFY